jgi:hypothetical protein
VLDGDGAVCSVLDVYRYCHHTTAGIGRPDIAADMARQRAEWR